MFKTSGVLGIHEDHTQERRENADPRMSRTRKGVKSRGVMQKLKRESQGEPSQFLESRCKRMLNRWSRRMEMKHVQKALGRVGEKR